MKTTYELALDEFRDASAAVRVAFGQVCEAREIQIIADSKHKAASLAHDTAMKRLSAAEVALMQAREAPPPAPEAPKPEPVPASLASADDGEAAQIAALGGPFIRVTQAEIDALEQPAWNNGAPSDQQLRIG